MTPPGDVARILQRCRTIAVVGLSPNPERASYDVAQYMQAQGYRIIAINPVAGVAQILGEPVYASLLQASRVQKIDLVNCFRKSADISLIADDAITIKAVALWMQLGIVNTTAAAKARAAGLLVVQDRCLKVDHRTLGRALK